ncbi:cupin domain-containing protein [Candidimonas humi]|jgi:mannose-6-phosphate isomerase-like protein (cupin superfamily)|uniref:Cupin domain-containing protein n=1 Tax=Candidimonas humi TaxID=683355 RepID=A0ABV8NS15_9BURK|nr:cupin domain-containing protein [Candidimonas humi]MBV6303377.1 cupin domain-containing protein [Candidimonas humi]
MPVIDINALPSFQIPGIEHKTVAGPRDHMRQMEMWMQTIEPGGATPVHRHDCEEAIVVLSGSGQCVVDGVTTPFGPNCTLTFLPNQVHQICNTGTVPMNIVAALSMAPVDVETEFGQRVTLPWDQHSHAN